MPPQWGLADMYMYVEDADDGRWDDDCDNEDTDNDVGVSVVFHQRLHCSTLIGGIPLPSLQSPATCQT